VAALGDWAEVRARFPAAPVDDRRGALVLPGLVDAHVHYPQVGVIGTLGRRLLEWLETRTLPHEARFADARFARAEARTFLRLLARNGTTTALVFGAHFAVAMEAFFHEAAASGLRIAAGLCVADRGLRPDLLTTPDAAYEEAAFLARRWHGRGRLRYAVTPRFSLSSTPSCSTRARRWRARRPASSSPATSTRRPRRSRWCARASPAPPTTWRPTRRRGSGRPAASSPTTSTRPTTSCALAAAGASVAHCPSSNQFLGSGLFPWRATATTACGGARHRRGRGPGTLAAARGLGGLPRPDAARLRRGAPRRRAPPAPGHGGRRRRARARRRGRRPAARAGGRPGRAAAARRVDARRRLDARRRASRTWWPRPSCWRARSRWSRPGSPGSRCGTPHPPRRRGADVGGAPAGSPPPLRAPR
jgi:hypothetical protein